MKYIIIVLIAIFFGSIAINHAKKAIDQIENNINNRIESALKW